MPIATTRKQVVINAPSRTSYIKHISASVPVPVATPKVDRLELDRFLLALPSSPLP